MICRLTHDKFGNNMEQLKVVECNYFIPLYSETEFKVSFSSNYQATSYQWISKPLNPSLYFDLPCHFTLKFLLKQQW